MQLCITGKGWTVGVSLNTTFKFDNAKKMFDTAEVPDMEGKLNRILSKQLDISLIWTK